MTIVLLLQTRHIILYAAPACVAHDNVELASGVAAQK